MRRQTIERLAAKFAPRRQGVYGTPRVKAKKVLEGLIRSRVRGRAIRFARECLRARGRSIRHPRSLWRMANHPVASGTWALPFLWLTVDDAPGSQSKRGFIERNSIGLLSNCEGSPLDPSSKGWLGMDSDRSRVRISSLCNNNHVDEEHEPDFLHVFESLARTPISSSTL
jgi:hypothetical protein